MVMCGYIGGMTRVGMCGYIRVMTRMVMCGYIRGMLIHARTHTCTMFSGSTLHLLLW